MKKQLLLLAMIMLPMVVSAYDLAVGSVNGVIYYNWINNGKELEVTFDNDSKYKGTVIIPDEVIFNGIPKKVTGIGNNAFRWCYELTSVTIPNSIKSIGECAFQACSNLISITIPNDVINIGGYAFNGCSSLTSLIIPDSVVIIRDAAFSGCSNLSSVTVGSRLKTISSKAFNNCKEDLIVRVHIIDYRDFCSNDLMRQISEFVSDSIMMVDDEGNVIHEYIIPDGVTSIGRKAFFRCSGLTSVLIPNSVIKIGKQAFYGCNDLLSVIIPNSVTKIDEGAFVFCDGLESVTIGKNVTEIGIRAFADTPKLKTIVSLIEKPSAFNSNSNAAPFYFLTMTTGTLYVPEGTINTYKWTGGWKDFRNIVEGIPAGIEQPLYNTRQIKNENGVLTIQNIKNGTSVSVYNANGTFVGSTISQNEQAKIDTNMQPGSVAIVKIGEQSVKVIIK